MHPTPARSTPSEMSLSRVRREIAGLPPFVGTRAFFVAATVAVVANPVDAAALSDLAHVGSIPRLPAQQSIQRVALLIKKLCESAFVVELLERLRGEAMAHNPVD
jgi:hypothetical protein